MVVAVSLPDATDTLEGQFVPEMAAECVTRVRRIGDHRPAPQQLHRLSQQTQLRGHRVESEALHDRYDRADMTSRTDALRTRLALLQPELLEIRDDSAAHAGHAGAREGGHFHITISSPRFVGLAPLERHRLVYGAVGDLIGNGVHALSIDARLPA